MYYRIYNTIIKPFHYDILQTMIESMTGGDDCDGITEGAWRDSMKEFNFRYLMESDNKEELREAIDAYETGKDQLLGGDFMENEYNQARLVYVTNKMEPVIRRYEEMVAELSIFLLFF